MSAKIAADGMPSVRIFLSYSHQDSEFAIKLYDDLTKVGFTVWKDKPRLKGGSSIISNIEDAICNANFFVLVLSPHSVNSSFVQEEYNMAIFKQIKSKSIRVIPLLLANCDIPGFLQEKNFIDFRDISEDKYQTGLKEIFTTIARQNNVEGLKEIEFSNKNSINYTTPKVFRDETSIFLGREEMIEQISSTLLKSKYPISLVGEGGVGKSALAYKIIHKCEDEFDARITIYFDMNITYSQFLSTIAEELGMPRKEIDQQGQEDLQDLLLPLLKKRHHPLVFADSYENIVNDLNLNLPSTDALKINSFLRRIPDNTTILITSRNKNNLEGEQQFTVEGLEDKYGKELFLTLARRHFNKVTPEIEKSLENLSREISGHPLSIKLLAGAYRGMGLSEIESISKQIVVNLENKKEEMNRMRSVKACFDYSFNCLDEEKKDTLLKLTIFNSPFLATVAQIFGYNYLQVFDLYDSSFLKRIDYDEYGDIDGNYRLFYFHPIIKEYLLEKVDIKQIINNYLQNILEFYYSIIYEAVKSVYGESHTDIKRIFNLIIRSKNNDFDKCIERCEDLRFKSNFLNRIGLCLQDQGIYSVAFDYHRKCLKVDIKTNDRFRMGVDCDNIAVCYSNMREFDRAIICEEKAINIHQNYAYELRALERDYGHFGSILTDANKLDLAEENIKKALEFGERTKNEKLLAIMYADLGILMFKKGYIKDGFDYRKKALDIIEHSPNDPSAAAIYSNMGMAYYKIGLYDIAIEWFMKALDVEEQNFDTFGMAREYKNISKIFFESGNLEKALEYQNNALEKHTLLDDQLSINNDKRIIEAIRSAMDNMS